MGILISDTSVLIDLERGDLVIAALALNDTFAVPSRLYELEILPYGLDYVEKGLAVESLSSDEMAAAITYQRREPGLSECDVAALALAKSRGHILLTGDAILRKSAEREGVECHGVLWVLDILETHRLVANEQLLRGLKEIANHQRCRLPRKEINIRLRRYQV